MKPWRIERKKKTDIESKKEEWNKQKERKEKERKSTSQTKFPDISWILEAIFPLLAGWEQSALFVSICRKDKTNSQDIQTIKKQLWSKGKEQQKEWDTTRIGFYDHIILSIPKIMERPCQKEINFRKILQWTVCGKIKGDRCYEKFN